MAHWAWRAFRADQELACDATVLAGASPEHRMAYGRAVLKSACAGTPAAACAMNHKSQLKQRIVMMKDRRIGTMRLFAGAVSAFALVAGGLVLTASGSAAAPTPPVPATPAAAPAPPAPPAPPAAPKVMIIKDGKITGNNSFSGSAITVFEGEPGKQVKTIIITRGDGPAAAGKDSKRIIVRCFKTARIENGKPVTTDSSKDCETIDMPDVDQLTADAMKEAGVSIAMIKPTIEHALKSARAAIEGNTDLTADQRAKALAGIDTAIRETLKDKPSAN